MFYYVFWLTYKAHSVSAKTGRFLNICLALSFSCAVFWPVVTSKYHHPSQE